MNLEFKYGEFNSKVEFFTYPNGNKGIRLIDTDDFCPLTTATINQNMVLDNDCVAIKNYSENEGIVEVLVEAGILFLLISMPTFLF